MSSTAVIIPYFSRQPGHLVKAVRSALGQVGVDTPTVFVIDDASPFPPAQELQALTQSERENVRLLHRPNGGPPAARNTGLDAVPPETDWVAFLDADDEWESWHLQRAQAALIRGFDFFFGDVARSNSPAPQFQQIGFNPLEHELLAGMDGLYAFVGDFFTPNITRSPVCTTTVVMRNSALGKLRFRTDPRVWEDLALWLEVSCRTKRIAFDTRPQARMSAGGITIVGGSRSNEELQRQIWFLHHFDIVAAQYPLTREQRALLMAARSRTTRAFAVTLLALLRDGRRPKFSLLWECFRRDPTVVWATVRIIAGKLFGRRL
jgi:succinoglycan biosynthesis protein ExoW